MYSEKMCSMLETLLQYLNWGGIDLSMCCVRGSSSEENQPWLHCMSHYPLPIWLHFNPCFNLLECFVLFQPERVDVTRCLPSEPDSCKQRNTNSHVSSQQIQENVSSVHIVAFMPIGRVVHPRVCVRGNFSEETLTLITLHSLPSSANSFEF